MAEEPDVQVNKSDAYREILVTGQVSNLQYDGLRLTVLHDSADLQQAVKGNQMRASKTIIQRNIECTLILSPLNLKAWVFLLGSQLQLYEKMFGPIPSPEELREKFKSGGDPSPHA